MFQFILQSVYRVNSNLDIEQHLTDWLRKIAFDKSMSGSIVITKDDLTQNLLDYDLVQNLLIISLEVKEKKELTVLVKCDVKFIFCHELFQVTLILTTS